MLEVSGRRPPLSDIPSSEEIYIGVRCMLLVVLATTKMITSQYLDMMKKSEAMMGPWKHYIVTTRMERLVLNRSIDVMMRGFACSFFCGAVGV